MSAARLTTCQRCGVEFGCNPGGACWCGKEALRLPLPKPGVAQFADCHCRSCLREAAAGHAAPDQVR